MEFYVRVHVRDCVYTQGMQELDHCHEEQQASMQVELKKEMGLLQKKIMMENVHPTAYFRIAILTRLRTVGTEYSMKEGERRSIQCV